MNEIVYQSDGIAVERLYGPVYLVRGYAEGSEFPSKYESVMTGVVRGYLATFKGLLHEKNGMAITIKQARAVDTFLKSLGCRKLVYERVKDGVVINVTRRL